MSNAKILVSDDEALWRETVLANMLRKDGYEVQTAATIEDTLQRIDREYFHVVFADICFSKDDHTNTDGVKTIEAVARWDEGTRMIVLTGYGTVDLAVEAFRRFKVFHFLEKGESFDHSRLKSLVKQAAQEAATAFTSRNLGRPIQLVTGTFDLHDAASKLQVKEPSIRWLIQNLMNCASPICLGSAGWEVVRTHGKFTLQKLVWSRMHGQALRLCICSEDAAKDVQSAYTDRILATATESGVGMLVACPEVGYAEFTGSPQVRD